VYGVDQLMTGIDFRLFAVLPRDTERLWAILTSPFIHGHLAHLAGNSLPLFLFSLLVMRTGVRRYLRASAFIILLGGIILWLTGRPALHLGASGWVFGLWGLIIADGWFERSLSAFLIGLIVILAYSGMAWGLLPDDTISFEAHLGGLIAGVLYSALSHRKTQPAKTRRR